MRQSSSNVLILAFPNVNFGTFQIPVDSFNETSGGGQYLGQLDGVDDMVHPPECSHLCNRLINKNSLRHFRKQF